MRFWYKVLLVIVLAAIMTSGTITARMSLEADRTRGNTGMALADPAFCLTQHNVGKLVLAVTNYGTFGDGFAQGASVDCFTGERVFSCEYPKGSRTEYLFAASFWLGAVVGRDTLVSTGADGWSYTREMFPAEYQYGGEMVYRSIMDPTKPEFNGAVSEQDYIAVYTDTFTEGVPGLDNDEVDGRPHLPLNIEITQRSYAWSYPYAEDFVLFDYSIRNIGIERLRKVYMGIYVDADVQPATGEATGFDDDFCGFIEAMPTNYGGCDWWDTVNIAWIADNDADFNAGPEAIPLPHVTSMRIVRTPSDSLEVSFNWWVSNGNAALDFGPQKKGQVRNLISHAGLGTPSGDRNKYYFMRNREFDYDQAFTASITPDDPDWVWPNQAIAQDIADGFDTRYLLSFGPFNIDPGQTLPVSLAYTGGQWLHTEQFNFRDNMLNTYNPDAFYDALDFSDLGVNAMWASWVYDNPGVDSDSSGYAGKYRLCCQDSSIVAIDSSVTPYDTTWEYAICDTVWYQGDGVPDFRGASPPPAPIVWVEPRVGEIRVRWNGLRSETTRDVFSREYDFEGYRVYMSRDERASSYVMLASYDVEDYNKFVYNFSRQEWELKDTPYSLEELRCLYGDSCFDPYFNPVEFDQQHPYMMPGYPDSTFYFRPQDFNRSTLGVTTNIAKRYPDQPYPTSLDPDSALADELTDDGYLKYFEYEYVIEDLLPTVYYYVNVTAFDYGSPQSGLDALETSKTINPKLTYPLNTAEDVVRDDLKVYVYPNPYRINTDGRDYLGQGYEGRDSDFSVPAPERERLVHFMNLPAKCTIRIFSLDGDLIRELNHDVDPSDPLASHDTWDMITRNTQSVVSGIYYWTVEAPGEETQVGKLVIIK